ncbi:MAG: TlpA family protein disulfide reductase [Candidatus Kapabacteria bacterium]|nr:TlpA family protein disulfide reductase [Candidatus Kapabacteria bacterium]MCS7169579.1 TlpA family protein disulfide reductase [Candidatus Kapabacteria bacterium]MDW7996886.1 TlpA disulfide reductase family protein [Bacteroidota bacterium]MDW8225496.1 TlpA disulfide reductase family protein [Bacteroidota bacterium]
MTARTPVVNSFVRGTVLIAFGIALPSLTCWAQKSPSPASLAASTVTVPVVEEVLPASGNRAPDFAWRDGNGRRIRFSELSRNRVVLLNFWATWCGPCRREIPDLIELHRELPTEKFLLIGISLDQGANAQEKVRGFLEARNVPYLNVLGDVRLADAYGSIMAIPTTFIIDPNGRIVERIVGARTKEQFLQSLRRVLK